VTFVSDTQRELFIGGRRVADDAPPFVIAELGNNGQGHLDLTKQLIKAAAEAGASAVKLQKRENKTLYTRAAYNAPYTGEGAFGATYGAHREYLEFGRSEYQHLKEYADSLGCPLFATAFDATSADFLAKLGVPAIKMASGDITNTPLLGYVASLGIPMIVSTGTADLDDVDRAVEAIDRVGTPFALLQCTAAYPVQDDTLNLRVIDTYRRRYAEASAVGLSIHTDDYLPAVLAYALGARVFEYHVTLSRSMRGTDHTFSATPDDLIDLVVHLSIAERMLGSPLKRRLPCEAGAIQKMAKSAYAARRLLAGHVLTAADIAVKSPGGGVPPYRLPDLLGRVVPCALDADDPIPAEVLG
jgi:sialic acid synthase